MKNNKETITSTLKTLNLLSYKKPSLTKHGHIADLTRFGGSQPQADFFGRRTSGNNARGNN